MLRIPGDASRDFCVTCYACHMVVTWIIMPWKIGIPVYDRNTLGTAVSASLCAPGDMECLVKHFPLHCHTPWLLPVWSELLVHFFSKLEPQTNFAQERCPNNPVDCKTLVVVNPLVMGIAISTSSANERPMTPFVADAPGKFPGYGRPNLDVLQKLCPISPFVAKPLFIVNHLAMGIATSTCAAD